MMKTIGNLNWAKQRTKKLGESKVQLESLYSRTLETDQPQVFFRTILEYVEVITTTSLLFDTAQAVAEQQLKSHTEGHKSRQEDRQKHEDGWDGEIIPDPLEDELRQASFWNSWQRLKNIYLGYVTSESERRELAKKPETRGAAANIMVIKEQLHDVLEGKPATTLNRERYREHLERVHMQLRSIIESLLEKTRAGIRKDVSHITYNEFDEGILKADGVPINVPPHAQRPVLDELWVSRYESKRGETTKEGEFLDTKHIKKNIKAPSPGAVKKTIHRLNDLFQKESLPMVIEPLGNQQKYKLHVYLK